MALVKRKGIKATSKRRRHEALTILDRQRLKRITIMSRFSWLRAEFLPPGENQNILRLFSVLYLRQKIKLEWVEPAAKL